MPKKRKVHRELRRHYMREWRIYRGLSQETAAARFDIDRTTLSKIERMLVPYDQRLLEQAAEAYACTVADLMMRDPTREGAPWSILDNLQKATPDEQRRIQAVVEAMLKAS